MNNDRLFDLLTILSIILQLQVYDEQKQQTNNDDLMHELELQDEVYLKQILENQKKIMKELNIFSPAEG